MHKVINEKTTPTVVTLSKEDFSLLPLRSITSILSWKLSHAWQKERNIHLLKKSGKHYKLIITMQN